MKENKTDNFQVRGDKENPYHLSTGAVVVKKNKIALIKKPDNTYTFPEKQFTQTKVFLSV